MTDYMQQARDFATSSCQVFTGDGLAALARALESLDTERTRAEKAEQRERELREALLAIKDCAFHNHHCDHFKLENGPHGLRHMKCSCGYAEAVAKADLALTTALIQPEPDPLVQEARNIVASMPGLNALQARAYRDGDWDAGGSVDIALAALKRGMELSIVKGES